MQVLLSAYSGRPALFAFGGAASGGVSTTNILSATGVMGSNTSNSNTGRSNGGGASYGTDKTIFAFGYSTSGSVINQQALGSNTGVLGSDTTSVGLARWLTTGTSYGSDKAIFLYGNTDTSLTLAGTATVYTYNLVSNTGVIAADATYTGAGRTLESTMSCTYGGDKGTFYSGMYYDPTYPTVASLTTIQALVSNTGVLTASNISSTNPWSAGLGAGAGYGFDKGIMGFGIQASSNLTYTSLVSNTGVAATFISNSATARQKLAASSYGNGQAVFAFGSAPSGGVSNPYATTSPWYSTTNFVSSTGVVASDTSTSATARQGVSGAVFG